MATTQRAVVCLVCPLLDMTIKELDSHHYYDAGRLLSIAVDQDVTTFAQHRGLDEPHLTCVERIAALRKADLIGDYVEENLGECLEAARLAMTWADLSAPFLGRDFTAREAIMLCADWLRGVAEEMPYCHHGDEADEAEGGAI